ncbi:sulfurtransferase [Pleurocapsales cyanobacterium LEGE 06147]|nr:sulfurtransferase [Pleurocapsales cyanobacterium LEGE 06147]
MIDDNYVTCEWLARQLKSSVKLDRSKLVVIDCRFQLLNPTWGYEQYRLTHIPGAYYLDLDRDLSAPVQSRGGRHPLPEIEPFARKLADMGVVKDETLVVAYDDSRFAFAARLWWLLRYLGHERVALLDGGWTAWQSGGYPVSEVVPQPQSGSFVPEPRTDWIVDLETVKVRKDISSVVLVDSRDSDRYAGVREPIDPIAGHIPGAVNSPWQRVTDGQGYLRPLQEQQELWADYQQADEIIVYCGSGVTACVNLFSLHLAGIEGVKLYAGGWSDWCSYGRGTGLTRGRARRVGQFTEFAPQPLQKAEGRGKE